MHLLAWILLAVTSLSLIARREGIVSGWLFISSTILGFFAFGFVRGIGYFVLLLMSSTLFYVIERFLSMGTAARLAREDIEKLPPGERPDLNA